MKNVTITLPDELLARLRVAAARDGKSMSRYVSELVEHRMGPRERRQSAIERFLAGPDLPGLASEWRGREELYAERLLRRHERADLPEGSEGTSQAGPGTKMGRGARRA